MRTYIFASILFLAFTTNCFADSVCDQALAIAKTSSAAQSCKSFQIDVDAGTPVISAQCLNGSKNNWWWPRDISCRLVVSTGQLYNCRGYLEIRPC